MPRLGLSLLVLVAACPRPGAQAPGAACAAIGRLLAESDEARRAGHLLRALARAEQAERACASADTRRAAGALRAELTPTPGQAAFPDTVRAATLSRLAGDPRQAVDQLRRVGPWLGEAGLAELGRAEIARGDAVAGQRALETAVAVLERRHGHPGSWRWQASEGSALVRIAFTSDGRLVMSHDNGTIRFWDVSNGSEIGAIPGNPHEIERNFGLSPDGTWMLAHGSLWNVSRGVRRINEHLGFTVYTFTDDGHLVVDDTELSELALPSGTPLAQIATGARQRAQALVAIRDKIVRAAEGNQGSSAITVWERGASQRTLAVFDAGGSVQALDRTARDELVIVRDNADHGTDVAVTDLDGNARWRLADIQRFAISASKQRMAVGTRDGSVRIHDLGDGRLLRTLGAAPGALLAFHPDERLLAAVDDKGIAIWNVETGQRTMTVAWQRSVRALAFDRDGERLAIGSDAGRATLWNLSTGVISAVTPRDASPVYDVAFGPGGVLATADGPDRGDDQVTVWSPGGTRLWSHEISELAWIGYRPGAQTLATAAIGHEQITLWNARGEAAAVIDEDRLIPPFAWTADGAALAFGRQEDYGESSLNVRRLDGDVQSLVHGAEAVSAHPGGKLAIASGHWGPPGRISVWDGATWAPRAVVMDEPAILAWSPDGAWLAAAGSSTRASEAARTVRIWEPLSGARLATLAAGAPITAIAIHPSGRMIAVARHDGAVELWATANAALLATLVLPAPARGLVFSPEGAVDGPLDDGDPVQWNIAGTMLPGRAAWDRASTPGLLAARLAAVPAEARPRAGLPGAVSPGPPPACFPRGNPPDDGVEGRQLSNVHVAPDGSIRFCVEAGGPVAPRLPACFTVDLATGRYAPRVPTPGEALGRNYDVPEPAVPVASGATVGHRSTRVTACRDGTCRGFEAAILANARDPDLTVNAAATLVAVTVKRTLSTTRAVYDVASGRRLSELSDLGAELDAHADLAFVGDVLIASCVSAEAEPCWKAALVDPWTGKPIAHVRPQLAVRVTGSLHAFQLEDSTEILFVDVSTGRVARRFTNPVGCASSAGCELTMLATSNSLAILPDRRAGDITLIYADGTLVQYSLPLCR